MIGGRIERLRPSQKMNLVTFEFLPKFGKSSYRQKPVSSLFKTFWTPAFAGVTTEGRF